jgi:hypothetical protein
MVAPPGALLADEVCDANRLSLRRAQRGAEAAIPFAASRRAPIAC